MEIFDRLYNDYLMPGQWDHYRAFLTEAKACGYRFVTHQDAESALASGHPRLFFLRNDVDSDVPIARTMFHIERELGVCATYYFRRCTADLGLMREILAFGSEVGYHYEELSDHIKALGIHSQEAALPHLDQVRETFLRNLKVFEDALGAKVNTVAGHGDFANRQIGLNNTALMNEKVRADGGIRLEAYDKVLCDRISFRTADHIYQKFWKSSELIDAIRARASVILVLVHPRHWKAAPLSRLCLDTQRLVEGIRYRLRNGKRQVIG